MKPLTLALSLNLALTLTLTLTLALALALALTLTLPPTLTLTNPIPHLGGFEHAAALQLLAAQPASMGEAWERYRGDTGEI